MNAFSKFITTIINTIILISDSKLWAAVRMNDQLAFNELFNRYWIRVYKVALSSLKDQEASEEVVHDVFLNIWNRRESLEINSFPNFLHAAIKYQIYNRRRASKLPLVYKPDYADLDRAFELNLGESNILQTEIQNKLKNYLNLLPKRCHEIFHMSRLEHLSNQEIADCLGVSKRTIENQLCIAVKHLKVCFKKLAPIILLIFN